MKRGLFFGFFIVSLSLFAQKKNSPLTLSNRNVPFDHAWLFTNDSVSNAEQPNYNDATWRKVDLPHDWSIEDLPNQQEGSVQGPFTKASVGQGATGHTQGGVGWYRKTFTLDKSYDGKQTYITFDGVYMNADVWINGHHLGNHPYGYTSFSYDLTNFLNASGKPNVIAVSVKNEGLNSRWYSGSGIYRHVWLTPVNEVHTEIWGNYITTPTVSQNAAQVNVQSAIQNSGSQNKKIDVTVDVISPSGQTVASKKESLTIAPNSKLSFDQQLTVSKPALWSLENPSLYKAKITLFTDGKVIDQTITPFGIRSIQIDAQKGFQLNGKVVKLKGGCIHHDNGPLGTVAIDRAEERKIELLKKAGYNAVRLSHNPMSPALLDACDRLGLLVVTDAFDSWEMRKILHGNHVYFKEWWQKDLESMILRDRNHPSIIMWGIGNEIFEAADTSGHRIAKQLSDEVRRLDPTRAVTEAINFFPPVMKGKATWETFEPHLAFLDVDGYNYYTAGKYDMLGRDSSFENRYQIQHAKHPAKTFMATEYFPSAALENWEVAEKYPYVLGGFSWTAMDYIGEAAIGLPKLIPDSVKTPKGMMALGMFFNPASWPVFNADCGDLDLIGNRKAASYYQNVVWRNTPIEILVHHPIPAGMKEVRSPWGFPNEMKSWTWPGQEGKKMQVNVYTRSKQVKLELNGKVIAEQTVPAGSTTASFEIPYQPGTLTARGFDEDKENGSSTLSTTGKPVAIRLVADRQTIHADANDLSYVSIEIVDGKGNVVPSVDDLEVTYQLTGDATLAGVGNGNPADMSSFQQNHKKVYQGRGLAILRPTGKIGIVTLQATASGLKNGVTQIEMK
ncbi:MAG: glycoside hydrolase family 2 [Segetibacter sp.]|nr:glycoside hydrolase family 2 [Segetibacter sp.]